MLIIILMVLCYIAVITGGKSIRGLTFPGYVFVGLITFIQAALLLYLLYTMDVPTP